MKFSTIGLTVGAGVIGVIVGGMFGASYALSQAEASAVAWHWLDASAVLANGDGSPKDAQQQRDSITGNFVARTYTLPAALDRLNDDALRARVIQRAKSLSAQPGSVDGTPLTMGGRDKALAILNCIASLPDGEPALRCWNY